MNVFWMKYLLGKSNEVEKNARFISGRFAPERSEMIEIWIDLFTSLLPALCLYTLERLVANWEAVSDGILAKRLRSRLESITIT